MKNIIFEDIKNFIIFMIGFYLMTLMIDRFGTLFPSHWKLLQIMSSIVFGIAMTIVIKIYREGQETTK